jgi:hypothetical protein
MGNMDYFGRMARDYDRLQRKYGGYGSGEITPADKLGMGLEISGAVLSDLSAEKERERELAREKEQEQLNLILGGRRDRTAAEQFERGAQQTDRSQNLTAVGMLADQRSRAMENSRQHSFRRSFLRTMGG